MYCQYCGEALGNPEELCQKCVKASEAKPKNFKETAASTNNEKPYAVLRPTFIPFIVWTKLFVLQINLTIMGGVLGALLIFFHQMLKGTIHLSWMPLIVCALFFFIATPILSLLIYYRIYQVTRYIFHKDCLEYYDGFIQVERKIIHYHSITEVDLKQSIFQRYFNVGSIYVMIPGLGGKHTGILIADVKNPEKIYQFLQKMI